MGRSVDLETTAIFYFFQKGSLISSDLQEKFVKFGFLLLVGQCYRLVTIKVFFFKLFAFFILCRKDFFDITGNLSKEFILIFSFKLEGLDVSFKLIVSEVFNEMRKNGQHIVNKHLGVAQKVKIDLVNNRFVQLERKFLLGDAEGD
jgi:hypothetical protein